MRSRLLGAAIAVLLFSSAPVDAQQPATCTLCGDWEGHIDFGRSLQRIRVNFRRDSVGAVAGTIDLSNNSGLRPPLIQIRASRDSVNFAFVGRTDSAFFASVRRPDDALVGSFSQAGTNASFYLVRKIAPDLALNQQYAGSYRLSATRFLDMGPFSEDGNRIGVYDSGTQRYHVLHATSAREFFAGPSVGVAYPKQVKVTFERDAGGRVTGLRWKDGPVAIRAPKIAPTRSEEIVFRNGEIEMHGTLLAPRRSRRPGVVVFAPGSGPAIRPNGFWPYFLARNGIATLTFDKRGVGASNGNWRTASYEDLANDLVGAVDALRSRTDVDKARIGIWANSESGWTAPIAASRSSHVKFLIFRSGSALPVRDAVAVESEVKIRDGSTMTEDQIASALALKLGVEDLALSKDPWEQVWPRIDSAYAAARGQPWLNAVFQIPKDHWYWSWWRLRGGFDPGPALSAVRVPVLVLLGDQDCCMPPAQLNAPAYERIFRESGNTDVSVRILPNASHGLMRASSKFGSQGARATGYVSGYLDGIAAWLGQHRLLDIPAKRP